MNNRMAIYDPEPLKEKFCRYFDCYIGLDRTGTYGTIYTDEREYDKNGDPMATNLIRQYQMNHVCSRPDFEELMQKSLDTGVNLIFDLVKDKEVVITDEMVRKAFEDGTLICIE